MGRTVATMLTMTTYGSWLRGDERGWVEDGITWPAQPRLETADRKRMKHASFLFEPTDLNRIGAVIGRSLGERLTITLLALTVQVWHVHAVIAATRHDVAVVVKCLKDAARYELRPGRPIWTDGYDKRFCFDVEATLRRVDYVEQHNLRDGLPARPWPFIVDVRAYLQGSRV